jgi:hypothetical protein
MVEKILQFNKEKSLFWSLLVILILFSAFYIYIVRTTINNVVIRQNFENEASGLSLTIGKEEFEYITKRNSINLDLAYSLGFKDIQNKTFISRSLSKKVAYLSN